MDLRNLLSPPIDVARLSKVLDELGHSGRLWSVLQWTRADMASLWDATKEAQPLTLEDLVPLSVEPLVQVVHHGKNSLPLLQSFQKRLSRPTSPDAKDTLVGYNVHALSGLTGPGYFTARLSGAASSEAPTEPRVVELDHTAVPHEKPPGWPPIEPNSAGLRRLVFGGVVDVLHRVSSHVTVGRVRRGALQNAWFSLVREDPPPPS